MDMRVTLGETEIAEAIGVWLRQRGLTMRGKPQVSHYAGDQREPSSTSITVNVEPIVVPT